MSLSVKHAAGATALDGLRMSASLNFLFPRRAGTAGEAVLINTAGAKLLLAKPLIFGRTAIGEVLRAARFRDCIDIRRDGRRLSLDRTPLTCDVAAHLARSHVADGAPAMALSVQVAADADPRLKHLRAMLPDMAGARMIGADVLVAQMPLRRWLRPAPGAPARAGVSFRRGTAETLEALT